MKKIIVGLFLICSLQIVSLVAIAMHKIPSISAEIDWFLDIPILQEQTILPALKQESSPLFANKHPNYKDVDISLDVNDEYNCKTAKQRSEERDQTPEEASISEIKEPLQELQLTPKNTKKTNKKIHGSKLNLNFMQEATKEAEAKNSCTLSHSPKLPKRENDLLKEEKNLVLPNPEQLKQKSIIKKQLRQEYLNHYKNLFAAK